MLIPKSSQMTDIIIPFGLREYLLIDQCYDEVKAIRIANGDNSSFTFADFLFCGALMYHSAATQGQRPCPFLDNTETT